jgi:hypothetical protein
MNYYQTFYTKHKISERETTLNKMIPDTIKHFMKKWYP